jgi:hypothetical protein
MLFLPYVFTKTAWEIVITKSHQRSILKIQKPLEGLIYNLSVVVLVQKFKFYLAT